MKPDFRTQFTPQGQNGFVSGLESRTRVFLLQAKYRGKSVFYYLQIPSYRQQRFKQMLSISNSIKPSQYGKILACGYGKPSSALEKKMEREFKVYLRMDKLEKPKLRVFLDI